MDNPGPSTSTSETTPKVGLSFVKRIQKPYDRASEPFGIKMLNKPGDFKYLLILDIDKTIYDSNVPTSSAAEKFAVRPHLREFLNTVHQYYEIIIWSATAMSTIEQKMAHICKHVKKDYKFLCFVNAEPLVLVKIPKNGFVKTKPLRFIWKQFPEFNEKNSIICDDVPTNFLLNEKNGIAVLPYEYKDFSTDNELLKLKAYLEHLAKNCEDFSEADHSDWRSLYQEDESNPSRLHKWCCM